MGELTPEQERLLVFMDQHGPKWFTLIELDQIRLLGIDDIIVVPSLVERGLLYHMPQLQAVALTAAGTIVADEIRSDRSRRGERDD